MPEDSLDETLSAMMKEGGQFYGMYNPKYLVLLVINFFFKPFGCFSTRFQGLIRCFSSSVL